MKDVIQNISNKLCYTELVYDRINKKLEIDLPRHNLEHFIKKTILDADKIERIGKNYYVFNSLANTRITVNANNFRVITADRIKGS